MATAKDLAMKICFCLIFFRILAFAWRDPDEVNCLQGKIAELQVSPPDWSQIILAANDAVGQGIGKAPGGMDGLTVWFLTCQSWQEVLWWSGVIQLVSNGFCCLLLFFHVVGWWGLLWFRVNQGTVDGFLECFIPRYYHAVLTCSALSCFLLVPCVFWDLFDPENTR